MHSISTSGIATLAHLGISCLASSLPSWIIDSGVSTYMIGKFTIFFFTFHTSSSAPFVIFANGSSKSIIGSGTVNLTSSLALFDVNYVFMFRLISYLLVF